MLGMHTAHAVEVATTALLVMHDGYRGEGCPTVSPMAEGRKGGAWTRGHAGRLFFCKHPPHCHRPVRRGYDTRLEHTIATIIVACTPNIRRTTRSAFLGWMS